MSKKLKEYKDYDKEVKSDGSEYITPEWQRRASIKYYNKNKEQIAENRRQRFMTDPAYRAKVMRTKKKNIKAKQKREKDRREWIAPYLVNINGELIVVYMCTLKGLANFLGRKQRTVVHWMEEGTIPKAVWRTRGGYHLYTEFQAMFMREVIENNKDHRTGGAKKKVLRKETKEFWEKWPYGFDLDDLEFEDE